MKQFVIVLFASLLGVLIALLVYDRLIVVPRELAQERAQEAERKREREAAQQVHVVSLERADEQARKIGEALDASVDRSVADARQAMGELATEQGRHALAVEALARASMVKAQLAEYYLSEGRWPKSGAEAGIAPASQFAGGAVAGIDVGDGGRITIRLTDRVTANARFRLSPEVSEATGTVRWNCELEGAPDIAAQLRACQH